MGPIRPAGSPRGFSVEEAVVGSGDAVESEGSCCPDHRGQDRDPVAAPLGPHPPTCLSAARFWWKVMLKPGMR
jgi:hypothetical protein